MKNIGKISASIALLFLLFFPALGFVHAATNDYTLLAPLPNLSTTCPDGNVVTNSDGTSACQTTLQTYLPAAFNLIVGIAAVLAFIMLTYGGVLYMTSDAIMGKSSGKEHITNALWGLGLVIASGVILFTIGGPNMLSFNLQLAQPQTVMQAPDLLSALAASNAAGTPGAGQTMTAAQIAANAQIAAQIGQTPNPCTQGQSTGCVNLVGLQQDTVTGIQQLKAICQTFNGDSCPNTAVTSGTDGDGRAVTSCHYQGTCVDMAPTPDINKTIETDTKDFTFVSKNPNGSCPRYTDGSGNTYLYETTGDICGGSVASNGTHWHITFK